MIVSTFDESIKGPINVDLARGSILPKIKVSIGYAYQWYMDRDEAYALLNELESAVRQLSDEEANGQH